MATRIKVLCHTHYGQERLYPNCKMSRAICRITAKKTLSETDLTILRGIGGCNITITPTDKRPKGVD